MSQSFSILEWRELRKGPLLGFARIAMPSGMTMAEVTILIGPNNGPYAIPPGKPWIGADGRVVKDAKGKTKYQALIDFTTKEQRTRFSDAVISALKTAHPEAFDNGGAQ